MNKESEATDISFTRQDSRTLGVLRITHRTTDET